MLINIRVMADWLPPKSGLEIVPGGCCSVAPTSGALGVNGVIGGGWPPGRFHNYLGLALHRIFQLGPEWQGLPVNFVPDLTYCLHLRSG